MKKFKIFSLFVFKQLMLARYHWKSLGAIVLALFGLQFLLLHFMCHPIEELTQYYDPEEPAILVNNGHLQSQKNFVFSNFSFLLIKNNGCFFDVEVGQKQSFYAPDTPEVVALMEEICGSDLNIIKFSHRETMMKTIEECKERCEGVYFEVPKAGEKTIKYTIYTNRMKIRTDRKYVTDSLDESFSRKCLKIFRFSSLLVFLIESY